MKISDYLNKTPLGAAINLLNAAVATGSPVEIVHDCIQNVAKAALAVDSWSMQADLHKVSGQDSPDTVALTPQVLLYYALQMEELGETGSALADAIHGAGTPQRLYMGVKHLVGYSHAADQMAEQGAMLKKYARILRNTIAEYFGSALPRLAISLPHAVEIADGAADVAVVNAGFSVSLGLPSRAVYDQVFLSNWSKINPDTGVIDKEPDGKWIKGANWTKPTLAELIGPRLWKAPE